MSRHWHRGIVAVIAVGLLVPAAQAGSDVGQIKATDKAAYTSVVYPNGADFPAEFRTQYPVISENMQLGPIPPDPSNPGEPSYGLAPVYYANIYTADALEVMAAIEGGRAEDYWKPIRWEYNPASGYWDATELSDPYPYPSTGRTYAGGGRILLKARNENGVLTPFNLGTWDPSMTSYSFSLDILADCVLEGEVLAETYPADSPLAGKNRMAEFVNGTVGIAINWFRWAYPFKWYASKVTLKNFVMRHAFFVAIAVYGHPDMTDRQDVLLDNVHILDVETWPDSARMPILMHSFNGSFKMNGCSVINTEPGPSIADIGVALSPNAFGAHVDNEVTNCTFRLPSTPWGSTAVVIDGDMSNPDFTQTTRCTGNSIEADVGFEVGRNYVGAATISNNPGAGGDFKARTMGFNVSTPESGTTVLIEKNTVVMDISSSQASFLPFSAAFFGWGFTYAELFLWGHHDDLGEPHNVVFSNNKVTGMADVGVLLFETASNNVFRANNIGQLNVNLGLTYLFGDDTRSNVVIGNTGGSANVYQGSATNTFTGPGFRGLGREAAQRVVAAVAAAKQRAASIKMNPQALAWQKYYGPIAR